MNLELRVKEPAPPSPALSEFKKIFSHTRLKLPPLGLTSLTLSLYIFVKEPALLLEVHFPIPFSSYRVDFLWGWLPMDMNNLIFTKRVIQLLAPKRKWGWDFSMGGTPPPYFCCFGICEGGGSFRYPLAYEVATVVGIGHGNLGCHVYQLLLKVIFLKCKIRLIYVGFNCKRKKVG